MELIQQALDKAKKQRDATAQQVAATSKTDDDHVATKEISYSQTQQVETPPSVLLKNKLVAGIEDDPRGDVFKILRTKVVQRMRANGANVLAITSPVSGAGKSMTASNLAISIAMDANYSVLLADLDFRNPSIHQYFGLSPEYGLIDYFEGTQAISDILIHPGLESLVILPAGRPLNRSSDLLTTPRMLELAKELKHRYSDRIVVVDLPPLLQTDDALVFMPNVDACLLVVAEGENSEDEVQRSIELIDESKFMGTVLNKSVEEDFSAAYY